VQSVGVTCSRLVRKTDSSALSTRDDAFLPRRDVIRLFVGRGRRESMPRRASFGLLIPDRNVAILINWFPRLMNLFII